MDLETKHQESEAQQIKNRLALEEKEYVFMMGESSHIAAAWRCFSKDSWWHGRMSPDDSTYQFRVQGRQGVKVELVGGKGERILTKDNIALINRTGKNLEVNTMFLEFKDNDHEVRVTWSDKSLQSKFEGIIDPVRSTIIGAITSFLASFICISVYWIYNCNM